jgi:hypothetical protein
MEHRYVMEEHIGRRLTSAERVHLNGNRADNRIENSNHLEVTEHLKSPNLIFGKKGLRAQPVSKADFFSIALWIMSTRPCLCCNIGVADYRQLVVLLIPSPPSTN